MSGNAGSSAAIVTGAGSGIGRAVAAQLGRRGWRLVLGGRREAPLRETAAIVDKAGGVAVCVPADVSDAAGRKALVERAERQFGRLDALINNAGFAPLEPFAQMSDAAQREIFEINALAPMSLTRAAWAILARGDGRVVNVSSIASVDPFEGLGVYGAAKAAVNLATLVITREGRADGVRAFGVAPGAVETGMLRAIVDEDALPTEACLTPEQVAEVIVACATGEHDDDAGATLFMPGPGEGVRVVMPGL